MLLIAAFVLVVFLSRSGPSGQKIVMNGDRAPEFRLPDRDGRYVKLSDLRGKVVMVHFWATWCPPCVEEIPTVARLNKELTAKDFVLLAVSVDEGGSQAVNAFLLRNGLDVPVLFDPDRSTAARYGTFKFPETYIVDREGIVRYKVIGPRDWSNPAELHMIQNILGSSQNAS